MQDKLLVHYELQKATRCPCLEVYNNLERECLSLFTFNAKWIYELIMGNVYISNINYHAVPLQYFHKADKLICVDTYGVLRDNHKNGA